jgi:hypothetical protein
VSGAGGYAERFADFAPRDQQAARLRDQLALERVERRPARPHLAEELKDVVPVTWLRVHAPIIERGAVGNQRPITPCPAEPMFRPA